MRLRLSESACVAKGTFNIYIFQPQWVNEIIGVEADRLIRMEADFSRPGFQFRLDDPKSVWSIRPDGIVVSSKSRGVSCGHYLAKVLTALPVTPMQALGNNFAFKPVDEESDLPCETSKNWLEYAAKLQDISVASVSASIRRGSTIFNTAIHVSTDDGVTVQVNVHRDGLSIEEYQTAAKKFDSDLTAAAELLENEMGFEVTNDDSV
ncbi:hypothetical protein [Crateriforma conspicua]|uniref:Uncharacterized protein n=1 Tax=Crateriforma conspicua TaxID=2527996 RepID=A0A5C5XR21_9PLAN|nr:hypothetical protein [Crateriforma conspicua]TWT65657.1 hypothetical protein Pan14r_52050 [Crateriforma conspicua]